MLGERFTVLPVIEKREIERERERDQAGFSIGLDEPQFNLFEGL